MKTFEQKNAYITGGSSGIGLTTAKMLAAEGANVIIFSRSRDRLDQAAVAAWKGSSGIPENEIALTKQLARRAKHSLILSFGSPYVLLYFKQADVLVAAYDVKEQAQKAVIKCLEGRSRFHGRLPVSLRF